MKYAVEAMIFDNGKIITNLREAKAGEQSNCRETKKCDVYVDIFDDYDKAKKFQEEYKYA